MTDLEAAIEAIRAGELVVYPTETVYGLGADALDSESVARVYEAKGRDRGNPLSMAVPNVDAALRYTDASDVARDCMQAFLPGPVTVICRRSTAVPDALTAGRNRVGIRIPDHELALSLLQASGPITATSANRSGAGSTTSVADLDAAIREAAAVVLDGGETSGTESTVVDPDRGIVHRRGAMAGAVESWLNER